MQAKPSKTSKLYLWLAVGSITFAIVWLLGPLTISLFLAIDWPIRKWIGRILFCSFIVLGLTYLLRKKSADEIWRKEFQDRVATEDYPSRFAVWLPRVAVAISGSFLFLNSNVTGLGDWDFFLQWYEAIRRSLIDWQQVPMWNPWCRGGFPLIAEPQVGLVSVSTLFSVLFGTSVGVRLAFIFHLFVALEGMRLLCCRLIGDRWAAAIAATAFALNGAMLVSAQSFGLVATISYVPLLLYFALSFGRNRHSGLALGIVAAVSVLEGIQYATVYGFVLTALFWLRGLAVHWRIGRLQFLWNTMFAVAVFAALAGWRIILLATVMHDFPRVYETLQERPILLFLQQWIERPWTMESSMQQIEIVSYVGFVPVGLLLCSFASGLRWFHMLIISSLLLAMGRRFWFEPSYWLNQMPVFSTMHVVSRWRWIGLLGICIAAGFGVHWLQERLPSKRRVLAPLILLLLISDLGNYARIILPATFSAKFTDDLFPGPPISTIVNVENAELPAVSAEVYPSTAGFPCVLCGYGVIRGYQPLLGYDRAEPTIRIWRGHPQYVGEFWSDGKSIEPVVWTPNRIVFKIQPNQELTLNQNPGSWWLVNGVRPFATMRCAEWSEAFRVRADGKGDLVLQVSPPYLKFAIISSLCGCALTIGMLFFYWRSLKK